MIEPGCSLREKRKTGRRKKENRKNIRKRTKQRGANAARTDAVFLQVPAGCRSHSSADTGCACSHGGEVFILRKRDIDRNRGRGVLHRLRDS